MTDIGVKLTLTGLVRWVEVMSHHIAATLVRGLYRSLLVVATLSLAFASIINQREPLVIAMVAGFSAVAIWMGWYTYNLSNDDRHGTFVSDLKPHLGFDDLTTEGYSLEEHPTSWVTRYNKRVMSGQLVRWRNGRRQTLQYQVRVSFPYVAVVVVFDRQFRWFNSFPELVEAVDERFG